MTATNKSEITLYASADWCASPVLSFLLFSFSVFLLSLPAAVLLFLVC